MALETTTTIAGLVPSNPPSGDPVSQADDHIRLIKAVLVATFPNLKGVVSQNAAQISSAAPRGTIMLWNGTAATCPAGWAICDGSTVTSPFDGASITTPNLGGRFLLGSGPNNPPGKTGGNAAGVPITVTTSAVGDHTHATSCDTQGAHNHGGFTGGTGLSTDQLPAHTHTVQTTLTQTGPVYAAGNQLSAAQFQGSAGYYVESYNKGSGNPHAHVIPTGGAHSHNIGLGGGGSHSHYWTADVSPSFYALYYIIRL